MFYITGYLLLINLVAFILMLQDKQKAVKNKWRTPERTLWSVALVGGAAGIWIGMKRFRHKTKHTSFRIGIPALVIIHIVLLSYLLRILS